MTRNSQFNDYFIGFWRYINFTQNILKNTLCFQQVAIACQFSSIFKWVLSQISWLISEEILLTILKYKWPKMRQRYISKRQPNYILSIKILMDNTLIILYILFRFQIHTIWFNKYILLYIQVFNLKSFFVCLKSIFKNWFFSLSEFLGCGVIVYLLMW